MYLLGLDIQPLCDRIDRLVYRPARVGGERLQGRVRLDSDALNRR